MNRTILLFGGTAQGRKLSQALSQQGIAHYYSTKTPTQHRSDETCLQLCGAMTAPDMAQFCTEHRIRYIIDAAHPFAENLHAEMSEASAWCGVPVLRLEREFSPRVAHPLVHYRDTFAQIISDIDHSSATAILAATGVNTIAKLEQLWKPGMRRVIFRLLDSDASREHALRHGLPPSDILAQPAPISAAHELVLLRQIQVQAVISKETGPDGGLAYKISASIAAGIPIYILCRPAIPANFTVYDSLRAIIGAATS